jgi:hypothetical protein
MDTKQKIIDEICNQLGIHSYPVSTGSTEPREFLEAILDQLGIKNLSKGLQKPELGKLIVESQGELWLPKYDSTGGTITKEGLEAIQRAVHKLTR